ncbi:hypothetical protein [Marinimicrobium koreense]|nr:hypothetical protein [Marinimicrobium koreense]
MLDKFSSMHIEKEFFFAPRPLPKQTFKYYVGYAYVEEGSKADSCLQSVKNYSSLSEDEFLDNLKATEYFWLSGDKESYCNALHADNFSAMLQNFR